MPRVRPAGRLDELLHAALRVFLHKGYRRTQMADVAREMGVSPGTLYNYVEGKEALFHLLVDRGLHYGNGAPATSPPMLPIPTPAPQATRDRLRERLEAATALPALTAALARRRAARPREELTRIVDELWTLVEGSRLALVLIERSALDMPELSDLFYRKVRSDLLARLARYMALRIAARQFRPVPDATAAARLVLETVSWFAMHRHGDKEPGPFDDATAHATVLAFVVGALVPEERA